MRDCFAYHNGSCMCLTKLKCSMPCRFYKSAETLAAQKAKVADRLDSLPEKQRESIRDLYYSGMNWR